MFLINQGFYVNDNFIFPDNSLKNICLNQKGLANFFLKKFLQRFEATPDTQFDTEEKYLWESFKSIISLVFPYNTSYSSKYESHILFIEIISTYRGWRHSKGLPVRGQRTWSNSNTVKKTNLTLRQIQERLAKFFYGNLPRNEINLAYVAEQVNNLWRIQWEKDWTMAKKRLKHIQKKNQRAPIKIDLYSMAKGQVFIGNEEKKSQKKNKKKKHVPKNIFSLGFDPGFTKALIRESVKTKLLDSKAHQKDIILSSPDNKKKSNVKKKKKDVKAKIAAHNLKKKQKKSVWD